MLVDYSGLYRFCRINNVFAQNYLQLLDFVRLNDRDEMCKYILQLNSQEKIVSLQVLETALENSVPPFDILFYLLSLHQFKRLEPLLSSCPTLYVVKLTTISAASTPVSKKYSSTLNRILKSVQEEIVDLKPTISSNFNDWAHLQKCLFHNTQPDLNDFVKPKTNLILIPRAFPKKYDDRYYISIVNAGLKFCKIASDFEEHVSTIWRNESDKQYIGTVTERNIELPKETHVKSLSFLNVFQDVTNKKSVPQPLPPTDVVKPVLQKDNSVTLYKKMKKCPRPPPSLMFSYDSTGVLEKGSKMDNLIKRAFSKK